MHIQLMNTYLFIYLLHNPSTENQYTRRTVRKVKGRLRCAQRIPVTQIEIEREFKYLNASRVAQDAPAAQIPPLLSTGYGT
jgi:hypothetical protein